MSRRCDCPPSAQCGAAKEANRKAFLSSTSGHPRELEAETGTDVHGGLRHKGQGLSVNRRTDPQHVLCSGLEGNELDTGYKEEDLKNTMLNEVSLTQKDKYCEVSTTDRCLPGAGRQGGVTVYVQNVFIFHASSGDRCTMPSSLMSQNHMPKSGSEGKCYVFKNGKAQKRYRPWK